MTEYGKRENLWRQIRNESLERLLSFLLCDEKDKWNLKSDFEKFLFFCQQRHQILGSDAEKCLRLNWSSLFCKALEYPSLFVGREECIDLWKKGNALLNATASEALKEGKEEKLFCDEKQHCKKRDRFLRGDDEKCQKRVICVRFDLLLSLAEKQDCFSTRELTENIIKEGYSSISFAPGKLEFVRPDPYHADLALAKIKNGEKCNNNEKSILFYQILLSISEQNKREKLQLNLFFLSALSMASTQQLWAYLGLRGLQQSWGFLIENEEDAEAFWKTDVSFAMLNSNEETVIESLVKQYPIGLLIEAEKELRNLSKNTNKKDCLDLLLKTWQKYEKEQPSFGS